MIQFIDYDRFVDNIDLLHNLFLLVVLIFTISIRYKNHDMVFSYGIN